MLSTILVKGEVPGVSFAFSDCRVVTSCTFFARIP